MGALRNVLVGTVGTGFLAGCLLAATSTFAAAKSHAAASPMIAWVQQSPVVTPPARAGASAAFDAATGNVVLFGGFVDTTGTGSPLSDTWIWNGTTWVQQNPTDSPSPRGNAAMAYDAATNHVVLFGGESNGLVLNDTWIWDGRTWTQQHPATSPLARDSTAMVYDTTLGKIILFGGATPFTYLNDTWAWDGSTWTRLSTPDAPTPRIGMSMAYDVATQNIVLFGGMTGAPSPLPTPVPTVVGTPTAAPPATGVNDTWIFDGQNWIQQFPTTAPSPRDSAAVAYFAPIQSVVLFGGYGWCCGDLGDTWIWNGQTWTTPLVSTSPRGRDSAAVAYDASTQSILLFGGHSTLPPVGGFLDDTWALSQPAPGVLLPRALLPNVAHP